MKMCTLYIHVSLIFPGEGGGVGLGAVGEEVDFMTLKILLDKTKNEIF